MKTGTRPPYDPNSAAADAGAYRVLIVDDNEAIHDDFRKALIATRRDKALESDEAILFGHAQPQESAHPISLRIESAMQGERGLQMVERAVAEGDRYLLAFVDMRMPPGWDGVETIKRLWEADPLLQIVICTAYSDYSWEQITSELGTTDRLLILKKPFDDVEARQLAAALCEKWLVTQRAAMKLSELERLVAARTHELRETALRDRLTGLPNRELLIDRVGRAIARDRGTAGGQFALLFIDFDRFKVVNDSLGHDVGDLLLVSIAQRLSAALRGTDTLARDSMAARLGGDEFVVLLDGLTHPADAARVTERLLADLARPHEVAGRQIVSTASIGVTTDAVGYATAEAMIRDADTAMYRAKAAGKNRYVQFDREMHEDAVGRLTLENDLRQAVADQRFLLHYQPLISLETARVAGFEALIRWRRADGTLVPPMKFIPLAEEIGVINAIGGWALREACRQLARWKSERPAETRDMTMSVNLSRRQLGTPDLPEQVRAALEEAGLRPESLILEITESTVMEDVTSAIAILQRIRELGVQLHIDDFGTGYSSLSCLHRFPINGLKIDRSFIRDIGERRDYAAVVHAVTTLAQNLGIVLVAEGIETRDQLAMIHTLGATLAQGYLFARPLPADEALAFATRPETIAVCADAA